MINRSRETVPLRESRADRAHMLEARARDLAELDGYLAAIRASDRPGRLAAKVEADESGEYMPKAA
jgi:hypothetical protein